MSNITVGYIENEGSVAQRIAHLKAQQRTNYNAWSDHVRQSRADIGPGTNDAEEFKRRTANAADGSWHCLRAALLALEPGQLITEEQKREILTLFALTPKWQPPL